MDAYIEECCVTLLSLGQWNGITTFKEFVELTKSKKNPEFPDIPLLSEVRFYAGMSEAGSAFEEDIDQELRRVYVKHFPAGPK